MLRKPGLICSCGAFQLHHRLWSFAASSPLHCSNNRVRRKPEPFRRPQCVRFAHVHDAHSSSFDGEPSWPRHPHFSPYDLFGLDRSAPYSKRRFYELAKLYHPDRARSDHPACKDLSDSARTERYRIIVAAHELLSDPVKREAYDKFGDGWHHQPNTKAGRSGWKHTQQHGGPHGGPDPIFRNATWEDWEEWRAAQAGRTATATAVPHNTFATFVILIVLFIGSAHAVTIGKYATSAEERVKAVHEKCSRFLDDRRGETASETDPDAKIQNFLIKRDPSGSGLKDGEGEAYRRILRAHRTSTVEDDIAKLENEAKSDLEPEASPDT